MKLVPFDPWHLVQMKRKETPDGVSFLSIAQLLAKGKEKMNGPSYTLFNDDGRIVGCGGLVVLWNGVGEGWGVPADIIKDYGKEVYEASLNFIAEQRNVFHRIQATVVCGFEIGEKYLTALGFEYEGILRKYGADGKDHKMFSIV